MSKSARELLILLPLAVLSIARGIAAIASGGAWEASKSAPAKLLLADKATPFGVGYIGLGLGLLGGWVFFSLGRRIIGEAIIAVAAVLAIGGFVMAM